VGTAQGKQLLGLKFRRQYSVGPYIVDFYCPELKLAIELDGSIHAKGDNPQYDAERQRYIECFGINFLRFSNGVIESNLDLVIQSVVKHTSDRSTDQTIGT